MALTQPLLYCQSDAVISSRLEHVSELGESYYERLTPHPPPFCFDDSAPVSVKGKANRSRFPVKSTKDLSQTQRGLRG